MGGRIENIKRSLQAEHSMPINSMKVGNLEGRSVQKQKSAKIQFEKIYLTKDQTPTQDLRGSLAITRDDNHEGWLHKLIYIGQVINSFIFGTKTENTNLCHAEVILGVNDRKGKEGELLLAHAIFPGIKTTSESHKKDKVITGINIYRPVDEKMRKLFAEYADQTAVNFKNQNLDPKAKDFKSRVKKEVGQFSLKNMITSVFHRQVVNPTESVQRHAAYAAADLLRKDKFRDEKGNLASFFCTGYMMTLTQGTALVSALSHSEKQNLKDMSRDDIALHLLDRIKAKRSTDRVSATYWQNDFMQLDARNTMSYFAGEIFNKASVAKEAITPKKAPLTSAFAQRANRHRYAMNFSRNLFNPQAAAVAV